MLKVFEKGVLDSFLTLAKHLDEAAPSLSARRESFQQGQDVRVDALGSASFDQRPVGS